MRKSVLFGLLSVLLVFASCKSKESAYKQAYEKAKAQESAQVQVNAPMQVTPVATTPVASDNLDQTPVRQEQVSAVSVSGALKPYLSRLLDYRSQSLVLVPCCLKPNT